MARFGFLNKLKEQTDNLEQIEGRSGADTIRLWERFREQAIIWKFVALVQVPATFLALIGFLIVFVTADISIEPPENPQPGMYSVKYLPDSEFRKAATEVINLIATYQPATALVQFNRAREYLWEPALSEFEEVMMKREYMTIQNTHRSQVFLINDDLIRVQRFPARDIVVVRLPGTQQALIGNGKPLESKEVVYYIKMTTIPRSAYNESGLVVIDIRMKNQTTEDLRKLDQQERMVG